MQKSLNIIDISKEYAVLANKSTKSCSIVKRWTNVALILTVMLKNTTVY